MPGLEATFNLAAKTKTTRRVYAEVCVCVCVTVRVCVWSYVCHAGNNRDTQSGAWQINKATLCKLRSHPSPFHPLHVAPINNPNMCKWQLASPGGAGSHYSHTNTHTHTQAPLKIFNSHTTWYEEFSKLLKSH